MGPLKRGGTIAAQILIGAEDFRGVPGFVGQLDAEVRHSRFTLAKSRIKTSMPDMKKALASTAAIILLVVGLRVANQIVNRDTTDDSLSSRTQSERTGADDVSVIEAPLRTKVNNREVEGPRATHAPERLKEFMLPEVAIDGMTLDEALQKLMGVYDDACKKTGETPLRLTFDIPPGAKKKLHLRLGGRNFSSSVQLLAALSGMTAGRSGLVYRFKPLIDERKPVSRGIRVPPDLASMLGDLTGAAAAEESTPQIPVDGLFRKLIPDLDSSTRLSLTPAGILDLETTSTADAAAVSALIQGITSQRPLQHKFAAKVIDLAAGSDWTPPDVSQMSDAQLQLFMRDMAQKQGTHLRSMPMITTLGGKSGTIEMIREWVVPNDDSGEAFETHEVGQVMQIQGSPLGFGHDLAFNFTDTTGEVDSVSGKPAFAKRIDVKDTGFSSDNGTRFVVQTRPDGSRTVVLVTSSMIDATGRPVHGAD